jgi:hypothetical protein
MAHNHRLCRLAFDRSGCGAEFGLDHQPVAVLGQCAVDVGELSLLAFALAIEPYLFFSGLLVGCDLSARTSAFWQVEIVR